MYCIFILICFEILNIIVRNIYLLKFAVKLLLNKRISIYLRAKTSYGRKMLKQLKNVFVTARICSTKK